MIVYIAVLDYFYDDYKRSEGYSEILFIYKDKNEAYKRMYNEEYKKNLNSRDDEEDLESPNEYTILHRQLKKIIEITDEFINKWGEARDEYLGNPEFGSMLSTGYRGYIKEESVR